MVNQIDKDDSKINDEIISCAFVKKEKQVTDNFSTDIFSVYGSDGIVRIINEKDLFLKIGNKKEKQIKLKYENIEKAELEAFAKSIKSKKEFPVKLSEVFENTKLFESALISKKLNSKLININ